MYYQIFHYCRTYKSHQTKLKNPENENVITEMSGTGYINR